MSLEDELKKIHPVMTAAKKRPIFYRKEENVVVTTTMKNCKCLADNAKNSKKNLHIPVVEFSIVPPHLAHKVGYELCNTCGQAYIIVDWDVIELGLLLK